MKTDVILFMGEGKVEIGSDEVSEPKDGELLIEAEATLISSGTEMICLDRKFEKGTSWDSWVQYPFRPGYSHAGRVRKVGANVAGFAEGDRVFTRLHHARHVIAKAADAVKVPASVDGESAAWSGLAKIVQVGVRRAEHKLGDAVVVIGMGPLGQLAVRYIRLLGPRELVAVDPVEGRLALAKKGGATVALAKPVADCIADLKALTNGALADVVYDVTGNAKVLAPALSLVRKLGTFVLVGDTGFPSGQCISDRLLVKGIRLVGAHDGLPPREASPQEPWSHKAMMELFLRYLERGQMSVKDLVTHRFPFARAAEAFSLLRERRGETMGVVLTWAKA
ncbi:MAG: zinc-binding alcohol dehydrogenase [Planctomycetota bacterium]